MVSIHTRVGSCSQLFHRIAVPKIPKKTSILDVLQSLILVAKNSDFLIAANIKNCRRIFLYSGYHCVKSVCILFVVILIRILSHLNWIRTRITPNTDNFYAVYLSFIVMTTPLKTWIEAESLGVGTCFVN